MKTKRARRRVERGRAGRGRKGWMMDDVCTISVKIKESRGSDTRCTNLAQGVRVLCFEFTARVGAEVGSTAERGAGKGDMAKTSIYRTRNAVCKRTSRTMADGTSLSSADCRLSMTVLSSATVAEYKQSQIKHSPDHPRLLLVVANDDQPPLSFSLGMSHVDSGQPHVRPPPSSPFSA